MEDTFNIFRTIRSFFKERKNKTTELKRIQNRLNSVLDSIAGNHWWKDREGHYLGCNKNIADLIGLDSPNDIIGKTDFEMPWAENATLLVEHDKLVMNSGRAITVEESFQTEKGKIYVLVTKAPLYDENKKIIGVVGTSVDITELKRTQKQLLEFKEKAETSTKAKSEFIANMSHDLRTPLTGLLGAAKHIESLAKNEEIYQDAKSIILCAEALLKLFNQIIQLLEVESGKLIQQSVTFSIYDVIKDNIHLLQLSANQKNLDLSISIRPNIPLALIGNKVLLDRVLLNLLSNAITFTDKGYVSVYAECINTEKNVALIKIIVEDTGIGIPSDKLDHVFESFHRLTPSYKGIYQGSGLGLYIVKQYLEKLGGSIEVNSEVGRGSQFIAHIPLEVGVYDENKEDKIDHEYSTPAEKVFIAESNTKKVLLVEDAPLAAMMAKNLLSALHCDVDWAERGEQALEKIQKNHYDFVYMDIGLPDMDGIEVAKRIRALDDVNKANIPIIALTAHINESQQTACLNAGMQGVLVKPLTTQSAVEHLKQYVLCHS